MIELMRTTVNLDAKLVKKATALSGIEEIAALLHAGLQALVVRESARCLAERGGSEPQVRPVSRRRTRYPRFLGD
jgi:hypothetical protein